MSIINKSCVGWMQSNKIVNENGVRITFDEHLFMLDFYSNWKPKQVCMKSAQVGFTTACIIKSNYACSHRDYNVIYTMPTYDDVKDFVPSKVDQMINLNPSMLEQIGEVNALTKKAIGNRFMWFRGTFGTKAAISHSSDLNIHDEYDASNAQVVDMYTSRLNRSSYKGEWIFSNPIRPGGVDLLYGDSDMRKWMIQCSRCSHWQSMNYEENICEERRKFVCSRCDKELSYDDRREGEWVAQYPEREVSGYHINQLMCPWVEASELVDYKKKKTPEFFYPFVLGLPYVSKDDQINKELLKRNMVHKDTLKINCALGVDVGHKRLHYVLGNHDGIFKTGVITDENYWDKLDDIIAEYKPVCVIDNMPDFEPKRRYLVKRAYPAGASVYLAYYQKEWLRNSLINWPANGDRTGMVFVKRAQIIDAVVSEIKREKIQLLIQEASTAEGAANGEYKEFVNNWENVYRTVTLDRNGMQKPEWNNKGPDHFVHAMVYWWMALQRVPKTTVGGGMDLSYLKGLAMISHEILDGKIPSERIPMLEDVHEDDDWLYPGS